MDNGRSNSHDRIGIFVPIVNWYQRPTLHHHHTANGTGWALRLSLAATLGFTAFEVWAGFRAHSLSLLSDAGHNFTDALALLLAAIGLHWQQKPADESRTYGYQRAGVLTAFINALTLVAISLFIFWE